MAVPLSALQHYLFCPRQCALIHVERQWAENRLTAEGRLLHETVDKGKAERRPGVRIARGVPLCSRRLGLTGIADLVELRGPDQQPYPVEYKRGRPKSHRADEVQLCAQALCLEEMLDTSIVEGALFYGEKRRRTVVTFDLALRRLTETVADAVRTQLAAGETPPPVYESSKCRACSLLDICRPLALTKPPKVSAWLRRHLDD